MQLVLATDSFAGVGGSETYLLTVAEHLRRLGHGVTIHAVRLGEMSDLATARGISIAAEPGDLPDRCDVVLTQDTGMAYDLADRWPDVPQVHIAHSAVFDFQLPALVSSAVVVMNDRVEQRVRAMDMAYDITRLRQPIDTDRLVPRGAPRAQPEKALLLGNYLRDDARQLIVDTWRRAGVEVVQVGQPTTAAVDPSQAIADADIVVGKGRAVLDAMACGRPAYIYDAWGTDGWVTPDHYPAMEADGFNGESRPVVVDVDRLRADLEDYDPVMGQANRELTMNHHQATVHAEELVALCHEVAPKASSVSTPNRELARLARARWQAELELFILRSQFNERVDQVKHVYDEAIQKARDEYDRALAEVTEAHRRQLDQLRPK